MLENITGLSNCLYYTKLETPNKKDGQLSSTIMRLLLRIVLGLMVGEPSRGQDAIVQKKDPMTAAVTPATAETSSLAAPFLPAMKRVPPGRRRLVGRAQ